MTSSLVTSSLHDALHDLLVAALEDWRVTGDVRSEADGAIVITTPKVALKVQVAPPEVPFRWVVSNGDRQQVAASVAGVLRLVRRHLDPDFVPVRIRVASLPMAPP